jgi:hypothetical protein
MEKVRLRFEKSGDQPSVNQLRALAISTKQRAHLYANNETDDAQTQAAQAEVAEWFAIWLQTPDLFADWLELRRRAPEFIANFGDAT